MAHMSCYHCVFTSALQSTEHSRTLLMPCVSDDGQETDRVPGSQTVPRRVILPRESEIDNLLDFSEDYDDDAESVFSRQTSVDSNAVDEPDAAMINKYNGSGMTRGNRIE